MISAWDVYLVFQLDSIGTFFVVSAVPLSVAGLIILILGIINEAESKNVPDCETSKAEARLAKRCFSSYRPLLFAGLALAFVATVLPSSKTAAAMIILPAITSDNVVEAMKPEAKELYNLAKEAMRSLVEQPKSKEVEK